MRKRRLKPIPKLIFNVVRCAILAALTLFVLTYGLCIGLYLNAVQMDNRYDYLTQSQNNEMYVSVVEME